MCSLCFRGLGLVVGLELVQEELEGRKRLGSAAEEQGPAGTAELVGIVEVVDMVGTVVG